MPDKTIPTLFTFRFFSLLFTIAPQQQCNSKNIISITIKQHTHTNTAHKMYNLFTSAVDVLLLDSQHPVSCEGHIKVNMNTITHRVHIRVNINKLQQHIKYYNITAHTQQVKANHSTFFLTFFKNTFFLSFFFYVAYGLSLIHISEPTRQS